MQIPAGYAVEALIHAGATTRVLRARRAHDGALVILKLPAAEAPSAYELARLRHEDTIARALALPGVLAAYGLEPSGAGLALVLEDCGGRSLDQLIAAGLPLRQALSIAHALAAALAAIHRRGVVHRAIAPANIIVNLAAGLVKLADFGAATRLPRAPAGAVVAPALAGALADQPPAQVGGMGRGDDERVDLYALGATLFELFVGRPPFADGGLLAAHPPAPLGELWPNLPAQLSAIVLRLLAVVPDDRYRSAEGAQADLAECLRQLEAVGTITPFPLGGRDWPERLQAPPQLYGREHELAALLGAFARVGAGQTELALVVGAAGVGKSALIRELCRPIADRGGAVIGGTFGPPECATPYSAFVQAFAGLARRLLVEPAEQLALWRERLDAALGTGAAVVAAIIPGLSAILGPQPPPPPLPPLEARNRLTLAFRSFVGALAPPERPLALVVEDLQWADDASLQLLTILAQAGAGALLLVGSYRDEPGPDEPLGAALAALAQTPTTRVALAPLDRHQLGRLTADALGRSPAETAALAELLLDQTGGNPLFAGELLASLAEQGLLRRTDQGWAWDPAALRLRAAPQRALDLLAARIRRLPAPARALLARAAALGTDDDLLTLADAAGLPPAGLAEALWPAFSAGLLVGADSPAQAPLAGPELLGAALESGARVPYQFQHALARQAAYAQTPAAERPALHLAIGRALLQKAEIGAPPPNPAPLVGAGLLPHQDAGSPPSLPVGAGLLPHQDAGSPPAPTGGAGGRGEEEAGASGRGGIKTTRLQEPPDPSPFIVVDQLNCGRDLIDDPAERLALAGLNLAAGRRARADLAYRAARGYLAAAGALLPADAWRSAYALAYAVAVGRAEAEQLCGDPAAAEAGFAAALAEARTPLDRAQIFAIRAALAAGEHDPRTALALGAAGLRQLGVALPPEPGHAALAAAIGAEQAARAGRSPAQLAELPPMRDSAQLAALDLLLAMLPCARADGRRELWALLAAEMVVRSYRHGNAPASAVAYAGYGAALATELGDYAGADAFGRLASRLSEPPHSPAIDAQVAYLLGACLRHWRSHMRAGLPLLARARQAAIDAGDLRCAGRSQVLLLHTQALMGADLDAIVAEAQRSRQLALRLGQSDAEAGAALALQWARALRGETAALASLADADFDAAGALAHWGAAQLTEPLAWQSLYQAQLLWLAGRPAEALAQLDAAAPFAPALRGTVAEPERAFYMALATAAVAAARPPGARAPLRAQLDALMAQLAGWAAAGPANYAHRHALARAELARLDGDDLAAMAHYDAAIEGALAGGFVPHAAMAAERAGQLFLARGQRRPARAYLHEARLACARWGALGQVRRIEDRYGPLAQGGLPELAIDSLRTIAASAAGPLGGSAIDLAGVLHAAEQIAGELVLERLLERLLRIVLEHAGAERGLLIVSDGGRLLIEAAGTADPPTCAILQRTPVEQSDELPRAIVGYVARSGESLVLDDAAADARFADDPYLRARRPRALLCAPLRTQGRLAAILYLEHNQAPGAFTPARQAALNLLTGQAAGAIENARIYRTLEASEQRYRTLFEDSRDAIFIAGGDGAIEEMNPAGLQLFGYSAAELRGVPAARLYADPAAYQRLMAQIAADDQTHNFTATLRRKDGTIIEGLISATLRRDRDGRAIGSQGLIRDVTAQRRAEQERLRLNAIERELTLANTIQQSLLPAPRPAWPDLDLVCHSVSARDVGGDLYAYYRLEPSLGGERYGVAVGDVTGKGMPAALLMAVSLASLRSMVGQGLSPGALLGRMDQALCDYTSGTRQNCALAYLEITRGERTTVRAANAGGIAPLIRRAAGGVQLLDIGGLPLGIGVGSQLGYRELEFSLEPGDILLLVSDGVVEAMDARDAIFGFEQFEQAVASAPAGSAEALISYLRIRIAGFVGDNEQHDDITLLAVRV